MKQSHTDSHSSSCSSWNKTNCLGSRKRESHSSRRGEMRMQLARLDIVDKSGHVMGEKGKDLSNLRRAQRLTQCHCHVLSCLQREETREQEEEGRKVQDLLQRC